MSTHTPQPLIGLARRWTAFTVAGDRVDRLDVPADPEHLAALAIPAPT